MLPTNSYSIMIFIIYIDYFQLLYADLLHIPLQWFLSTILDFSFTLGLIEVDLFPSSR
jgi:hypothetical protein